ncbi:MAG: hypothetical protein K0S32_4007 [Bacteroidetes bacterium]|jgi:uncharacterized protein (TIGR02452 family)|nr:hypothetical protein [Bacteroidota bacterium]
MDNRTQRQTIAEHTLQILKDGYFVSPSGNKIDLSKEQNFAEENTITYSPQQTDDLIKSRIQSLSTVPAQISVVKATTLDAARQLIEEGNENPVLLNFASAKNAGGGFLGGSQAQEESIARSTGLYNCLLKAPAYYETNRHMKSCFYTDYMIYSPKVPLIKNENGDNLDSLILASVITAPAVNTGVVKQREKDKMNEIEPVMKRRMEKVLSIALKHGHDTIVLGAWGCGVFQNEPKDIAKYFREVIDSKFKNAFRKIVFAIYSSNEKFIEAFQNEFVK